MKSRKASPRKLASGCAEPGPGDGRDPRYDRDESADRVENRKALQLCKQVELTLSQVLGGESSDEVLQNALIQSVIPAPHSGRLLVSVMLAPSATADSQTLLEHLLQAAGRLRSEVAQAIHRRKAPELSFRVVGAT